MTKLDYNKTNKSDTAFLNDPYWSNPKTGFDKGWHDQQKAKNERKQRLLNQKIDLGTHKDHTLDVIKLESGPHDSKLICITCNNKFIRWLPKGII
jgi:hypothetical protein